MFALLCSCNWTQWNISRRQYYDRSRRKLFHLLFLMCHIYIIKTGKNITFMLFSQKMFFSWKYRWPNHIEILKTPRSFAFLKFTFLNINMWKMLLTCGDLRSKWFMQLLHSLILLMQSFKQYIGGGCLYTQAVTLGHWNVVLLLRLIVRTKCS